MPSWLSALGVHAMRAARAYGSEPAVRIALLLRMRPRPLGPVGPWIALALAALALLAAGYALARLLLPRASRGTRALAALLLALALQNAEILFLSLFGAVSRGPLLALSLVLAALAAPAALRPLGPREDERPTAYRRRTLPGPEPVAWAAAGLLGAAAAVWYVLVVETGLKLPEVSWDALAQHGASAAAWLQAHRVTILRTDDYWLNVYPMNTEVSYLWQLALLHRDNLLSLGQLPYVVLGALATYVLARGWGAPRPAALAAAFAYTLVPNVLVQARAAYVDVAFCSLFLAGLALWDGARAAGTWGRWLLVGLAIGLLAGTKPTGLLYGGSLGIATLLWPQVPRALRGARSLRDRLALLLGRSARPAPPAPVGATPRRPRAVAWWWRLLLCLAPACLFGLRWYLRTYLAYGDPLYPFPLAVGGHVLFHGPMALQRLTLGSTPPAFRGKPDWYMLRLAWLGLELDRWYVSAQGWLGTAWPYLELPALVLWILWGSRRAGAWPALAVAAVCFAFQPLNWWPRYTLYLPALGAAALASLPWPTRWSRQVALLALAVLGVVGSLGAAPRLFFFVPQAAQLPPAERQPGMLFAPASYAWTALDLHPGDRVGYAGGPTLLFELWGPALDRTVLWAGAPTRRAWLTALRRERITVFTTQTGSRYARWMQGVPATPLTHGGSIAAWRLAPPPARGRVV